jgi:hypothetical protein
MYIGAGIGVVAGLTNFFLPHTPPKAAGVKMSLADLLGLRAAHLLTDANFAIFVLCSFLIMIPAQFYWVFTNPFLKHLGFQAPQALQSLAQVSELAFMFVMPLALVWLRVRWLLLVGLLAWVLRFALLAYGNAEASVWTIYLALLMHGGCFAFFFIGGQLYVDRKAPKELQASAQGFIAFITWGLGQLAGAYVAGAALDYFKIAGTSGAPQIDWHNYWLTAAALAVGVSLLFLAFREKISLAGEEPAAETAPLPERLDT